MDDVLPLSPLQHGMLFHALFDKQADGRSRDLYTGQMVITVDGPIEADRLHRAADALLARHANLRVEFRALRSGTSVQVVRRVVRLPWREVDLSGLPDTDRDRRLDLLVTQDRTEQFDLKRAPLLRFTLVKLGTGYRLLFSSHHIVLDGWSTPIVLRELCALYAADADARAVPPVRPYRDYLAWLSEQDRTAAEGAWGRALAELSGPTLLVPAAARSSVGLPDRISTSLAEEATAALSGLARRHGLTVSTVVQGLWSILLSKLTGRTDVVFGATVSGRPAELPDVESMVGLFINTLPVRVRLRPAESVLELLARIQSEQSALLEHQHLGLADIQRAAGHVALFDTLLVFENYPLDGEGLVGDLLPDGPRISDVRIRDATHYPLTVIAVPGDRLSLTFGYQPGWLDAEQVHRIATWMQSLLLGFIAQPDRRVGRLDLLAEQDRHAALSSGNRTEVGLRHSCVRDMVRAQIQRTPLARAVIAGDTSLSYADLAQRVRPLADRLAARGAGPGSIVAVALPRSVDLVVALLAVLEVGAAYLPIDVGYPAARIDLMLTEAPPHLVVCDQHFARSVAFERERILEPGEPGEPAGAPSRRPALHPDHPAYVIFTSGSTGRPKAVVGTQRALANRLAWGLSGETGTGGGDVRVSKSPMSFIDGTTELLTGLVAGDVVVVADDDTVADPLALVGLVDRHQVSIVTLVPSLLATLVEVAPGTALTSVRTWVTSGEALPPKLAALAARRWPQARWVNLYGCSEVAGDSLAWVRPPGADSVAIGAPIANTRGYVLDRFLRVTPDGIAGELYLAGDGLARGYLAQPAGTAQRFVADPFNAPGSRLYRTGDLVRRRPDGMIEFLGRTDDQLKIRGFRVEPGDVEAAACSVPGVAKAVVVASDPGTGERRLVGYVVPENGAVPDPRAIREELSRRLPGYAVPSAVVVLDALPLTPNGKLNRRALPVADFTAFTTSDAPRNEPEELLCGLFAEVLGLPRVGIHDSFFELGGDSILSIQLVSRAHRAGLGFSPRDVFTEQTVAALAVLARTDSVPAVSADADQPGDVLPLSPLARGLLYHALFDENERDVYTMQATMELAGDLDSTRLHACVDALLARHANLRTAFRHEDLDEPVQVVLPGVAVPWIEADLSQLDDSDIDARVTRLLAADRSARFDLSRPPLLRFTLIRTGAKRHLVVVTNHHLLLDGWSLPLLVRELLELYATGAHPSALPQVRPYRDFLAWLAAQDQEAAGQAWQASLAGVTEPTLLAPVCVSRVPVTPDVVTLRLPEELTSRLHRTAASCRLTVNTVVQGLWGLLLGGLTGRDDVVFGVTVSGRPADLAGIESMIGLFINTVPCRVQVRPGEAVRDLLRRVQDEQSRLIDFHQVALSDIQRPLGLGELFDTLVVFENYPLDSSAVVDTAARGGLLLGAVQASGATHYPLTVAVFDGPSMTIDFEARPDVFDHADVEALAGRLRRLIEAAVADPGQPVARLDILSTAERTWLLAEGTGPRLTGPATTLPEVFEAQAARTPDATAVVGQDLTLTFGELNARANRLARLLVHRGAAPERIVVLALPAVAELIVAILAVHKAGAAYLPIEQSWPAERRALMLADACPIAVVSTTDGTGVEDTGVEGTGQAGAILLDDPEVVRVLAHLPEDNLTGAERDHLRPEHPAYVIYTSGSTGVPKAVVVPHRAIVNLLAGHRSAIFDPVERAAGRPLRVGHAWSTAFDASWQPMLWMFAGHELHLVPEDVRHDPELLREFLATRDIEFIELPPALLGEVVRSEGWRGGLRVIGVGGEAVPSALWRTLRAQDGLRAYNLYGPTECTVDSAVCDLGRSASPAIGGPVGNAAMYVLDRRLNPVPVGVCAELYIAGAGLARGYLGRPAVTACHFVADPFADRPGTLMYRTGDLARWTPDGLVECLGRADGQVKIRGFRVELGEIESALARHEQVDRAAVVVREGGSGVRQLVGYVIAPPGVRVVPAQLREFVAELLPEYMVPVAVIEVPGFPLTSNGKLDVAALPAPGRSVMPSAQPPRNETERRLTELVAEVLGLDSVGVHDSFFALGGDSIVSMRLVSRARAAGLSFSPRDVFERRTVAGLAAVATEIPTAGRTQPDAGVGDVPLTPILEWLVQQGQPFRRLCQARVVQTPADLDLGRLQTLVQLLLDRHDVLRSTFALSGDGSWSFTIHAPGTVQASGCVRRFDAQALDHQQLSARLPGEFADAVSELDPVAGSMVRVVWFDAGPGRRGRLLIVLHHLVVDAASWQIILADLAQAWRAVSQETPYRPGPVGTAFRDWARGLRAEALRPGRSAEIELWTDALHRPDPVLGSRRLDPAVDTRASMRTLHVSMDAARAGLLLRTIPDRYGVTVNDVLLTGLVLAVTRWRTERGRPAGDGSVLVALEGHGRAEQIVPQAQLSDTVGWFTSVFPARLDPGPVSETGVGKALLRVAEQLAALPDKGIGYGLLRYLNPVTATELKGYDDPQIEFNYLGRVTVGEQSHQDWASAPESGALIDADPEMPAPYCLVIDAAVVDGAEGPALRAYLQWPDAIFDEPDIGALSRAWFAALDLLAAGDSQ
ncbi:MAG: amino acid adenylation domain-containing protein [Pseudonocardiaceae bacterium]